ncbi:MAG: hypothetical protein A4E48_00574 [Methanosaeta sp. PtaU1.Bin060]|jgi:hypothetical protein|nr:MAG: hypothetical protein A4E48_00574 [Methanosaeta sp. PtaU1.Bin060]
MKLGGFASGILFIVGLGAILVSGGTTTYMVAGDALIALGALAFVKLS